MKRIFIIALLLGGCAAPVTTKVKMPPSPSGLVVRQAPKAAVARTVAAALVVRTNNLPGLGYHIVPRSSVPATRKTKVGRLLMSVTPMAFPDGSNTLIEPVMIVPPVWVPDPIVGGILYTWSDFLTTGAYYVAQTNATLKAGDWGNVGVAMKWTGTTNDVLGVGCAAPNPRLFERIKVSVTP